MDKESEHFSRDEIQVANRYTRSWQMRTKATIRIISHLSDWLLSKRQEVSVGQDVEKREPGGIGWNVNWCSHYRTTSMEVPQKT